MERRDVPSRRRRHARGGGALNTIRPYQPADRAALYRICLQTGDSGHDATHLHQDPDLLGHRFVGPYLELEPSLAFVLTDDAGPVGYVVGALDSRRFEHRAEREWWPALRGRYPDPDPAPWGEWTPDQRCAHAIHHPGRGRPDLLREYPSHLHINLLPRAQGNGHGRRMLHTLFDALRARGSPGVHLGTGRRNHRAVGFYRHVGFTELESSEDIIVFGMRL